MAISWTEITRIYSIEEFTWEMLVAYTTLGLGRPGFAPPA